MGPGNPQIADLIRSKRIQKVLPEADLPAG